VLVSREGGFAEQRPERLVRRRRPIMIRPGFFAPEGPTDLSGALLARLDIQRHSIRKKPYERLSGMVPMAGDHGALLSRFCIASRLFQKPKASFSDGHRHATACAMPINSLAVKNSKAKDYKAGFPGWPAWLPIESD